MPQSSWADWAWPPSTGAGYVLVATGPGQAGALPGGWVTGASDSRLVPVDVCQSVHSPRTYT